ncbi:GMC family oxidoreductase N-terminal domain-containing protein [Streptomyces sp. enrichment culture]|uniref:GMC family oxidoreductase N-terminal domain-containing protein n=1 Tax=Streptomyces sp. enrichment culture TaxID=1795815 RepID=UPI003F55C1F5
MVLEEGRHFSTRELASRPPLERFADAHRDGGATLSWGLPPVLLPLGRAVGGTTLVNSGTCFRTPPHVLDRWQRTHGVEPADRIPSPCTCRCCPRRARPAPVSSPAPRATRIVTEHHAGARRAVAVEAMRPDGTSFTVSTGLVVAAAGALHPRPATTLRAGGASTPAAVVALCEPSDHHHGAGARRDRTGRPPRRGMTERLPPVTNGRPQSRGRGRRVPSCRPAIRRSMTASPRSLRIPRVVYVLPPPTG